MLARDFVYAVLASASLGELGGLRKGMPTDGIVPCMVNKNRPCCPVGWREITGTKKSLTWGLNRTGALNLLHVGCNGMRYLVQRSQRCLRKSHLQ
jgi:hypothetical protein